MSAASSPLIRQPDLRLHAHMVHSHTDMDTTFLPFFQMHNAFQAAARCFILLSSVHDPGVKALHEYLQNNFNHIALILHAQGVPYRACICSNVLMIHGKGMAHTVHFMLFVQSIHEKQSVPVAVLDIMQELGTCTENY